MTKNIILSLLVVGVLVAGYFYINKDNKKPSDVFMQYSTTTESATDKVFEDGTTSENAMVSATVVPSPSSTPTNTNNKKTHIHQFFSYLYSHIIRIQIYKSYRK
jgi:hypothetical protein